MTTIVASANLNNLSPGHDGLTDAQFEAGLRKVLAEKPDIAALQEAGPSRNAVIARVAKELGYGWTRPEGGGEPVLWRAVRYRLRSCKPFLLARAEFVGHLPGRKDRLPANHGTELILDDLTTGEQVVTEVFHLTAEIQDVRGGGGYKKDPAHWLRVLRHKREKRRLGRRSRMQKRRGRVVRAVGDGNYAGMTLGGFVNCWEGRNGGTLGGRAVDIVFADRKPHRLWTITTPGDHDALVVTYP